jgi:hypothetical protein
MPAMLINVWASDIKWFMDRSPGVPDRGLVRVVIRMGGSIYESRLTVGDARQLGTMEKYLHTRKAEYRDMRQRIPYIDTILILCEAGETESRTLGPSTTQYARPLKLLPVSELLEEYIAALGVASSVHLIALEEE